MLLGNIVLRSFIEEDFEDIQKIYAQGIATGIATFETEVPTWSIWDEKYIKSCRLVAELEDEILGFAVLSQTSKRSVYKGVAEVSLYVAENKRGNKIGKQLLERLIKESEAKGFWTLQAGIFEENKISIHLHESCGFRIIGVRERIGKLNNQWFDNVLMERRSKITGI